MRVKARCLIEAFSYLSFNFPHKMALLKFPCAFRLRSLAQSVLPSLGIGFPPQHHHLPPRPQHPPHHIIITIAIFIIIIIVVVIIIIVVVVIIIILIMNLTIIIIIIIIIIITNGAVSFCPPSLFGVSCRDDVLKSKTCFVPQRALF